MAVRKRQTWDQPLFDFSEGVVTGLGEPFAVTRMSGGWQEEEEGGGAGWHAPMHHETGDQRRWRRVGILVESCHRMADLQGMDDAHRSATAAAHGRRARQA